MLGYRPCGACDEYVVHCDHWRPGGGVGHRKISNNGYDVIRQKIIDRANGHCETCGKVSLLLTARSVNRAFYAGKLRLDNGVAVCAICRSAARGKDLSEWVLSDEAPPLAAVLIARRRDAGQVV